MSKNEPTESLWSGEAPNPLIPESEVPSKADELASLVDDWLSDYTEYVDPFNWESTDKQFVRKKAFAELSSYLLNAYGVGGDRPLPDIHELIVDRVNDRRFLHLTERSPRELHHFSFPFIYAGYFDTLEGRTESRLESIIKEGAFLDAERVQYRQLEYNFIGKCFSQIMGYSWEPYDAATALENSVLNHQPNVARCLLPDAYCLTHDVFFYNNYNGIFPDQFPDEPAPYDISDLLRGLILRYIAEDNCDIVLELLFAGVLQRQISRQMAQFVLSWVFEKVEGRGYVPGPGTDRTAELKSMDVDEDSLSREDEESREAYGNEHERIWVGNFHTNQMAGMTARILSKDWEELDKESADRRLKEESFRRDATRLGEVFRALSKYDLKTGARRITELANSPVINEYGRTTQDAIEFLENQRNTDGEFGYWTKEEILFTNGGNSPNDFQNELVKPVSKACREALDAFERGRTLTSSY